MARRAPSKDPRMRREKRTVLAMVRIFCGDRHPRPGDRRRLLPCAECRELLRYAFYRLDRCPFGPEKPTCVKCPIHCYRPEPKERMRDVMRHSGPRMLLRHPWLAIGHILDGRREAPAVRGNRGEAREPGR